VEQLLSLVFGERCGSGLFIKYFPYIFLLELRKIITYLSEGPIPGQNLTNGYLVKPTPWRRVLEKLIASQLVKKFPAFHRTQRFITVFKSPPLGPNPEPD
jgi:hypothetical protein